MTRGNLLRAAALTCVGALVLSAQSRSVPAGAEVVVRTNEAIDAKKASDGKIYTASIDKDVQDDTGRVVIPKGSPADLIVRSTADNELSLDLEAVNVNGRRYLVDTADESIAAEKSDGVGKNKRTAKYVGGGALIGSVIGAIAGGGKGAAIGAATGAGAGALGQTVTRGKAVKVPSESLLTFRLDKGLRMGGSRNQRSRSGR